MAHVSLHKGPQASLTGQQSSSNKEKTPGRISFFEKLIKAREQGTENKGNNPIIGIANLIGRMSRPSASREIDERMIASSAQQLAQSSNPLISSSPQDYEEVLSEDDDLSSISSHSQSIEEAFIFDADSEDALSRLRHLSQYSDSSEATRARLFEDDETPTDGLSDRLDLSFGSQEENNPSLIQFKSYRSRRVIHKAIQTEPQIDKEIIEDSLEDFAVCAQSKNNELLKFFWGAIKFALLPVRIFISFIRFLWYFDENIECIQDFFIHSGNMIKQSDLFLSSINDSELVFVAATLMEELEEITSNLRALSFDENLSKIVENSAKISQDLAQGEKIKSAIKHVLEILDSINSLSRCLKAGSQFSFNSESCYEKVSDILTSLNTILDDMVFKGPFKGLMGAWDKYRKDRLESYEKLHTKEHFEEAVAKEVRDLEIIFKRYHALLDKAKDKGAHHVTVSGFNYHLSRLTAKTQHVQSQVADASI